MSHAEKRKDVIVINDSSDIEDTPLLASGGSVVLLERTLGSRSRSPTAASFHSGKSEPGSRYTGSGPRSESQIRELLTGTSGFKSGSHSRPDIEMIDETGADAGPLAAQPRDIIEINSDEFLDGRPVSFQIYHMLGYMRLMMFAAKTGQVGLVHAITNREHQL